MNILVLTHNYPKNEKDRKNAGIFIADFKNKLSKKQTVFVKRIESNKKEKFGNWSIINPLSPFRFIMMLVNKSKETETCVRSNYINFILAFWALPSGVLAYINFLKNKTPYAVWCLGSDLNKYIKFPILRQLIILSLKNASIRFANSHALCKLGKKLTGKNFVFLPAVTDFKPNRMPNKIQYNFLKDDFYRILFVGRLEKIKGADILINSLNIVRTITNKRILVNILGDGRQKEYLKSITKKNGINEEVVFHGFASLGKVVSFMRNSDVLVIPSRNESLPLVMIEAAKSGLPVIASDVGDCKFLIRKYNTGMVFEAKDVLGLSKVLIKMIGDDNAKDVYTNGMKQMAKDFSIQRSIDLFNKEVYKML